MGGRGVQAEGMHRTKALRWELAGYVEEVQGQ